MPRKEHDRVSELFFAACDMEDAERLAFLDDACRDEPDIRASVEALLRHDRPESSGDLTGIVQSGMRSAASRFFAADELTPGEIGPYTIVDKLGEGGMSVVYEAEQHEPVKRRVALKVIRPGMDTREVIARFDSERHALAVMDHPNIAQIFDGGASANGRPYFVMELVHGEPITAYCDRRQLDTTSRLKMFLNVCAAVQHAHQKGVVHRDLKPSNIMVTEHDGKPVVKVIDFGIAKAVDTRDAESEQHTRLGQMIGTPAYMSPEQATGQSLDIDTRTDIYSLGVVLYQVLVGALPYDLTGADGPTVHRVLRDTPVTRPSIRFRQSGDERTRIAGLRRTEPGALARMLSVNLDWIVLKAMEKERGRRYQTVNALALDIVRFLEDRPVSARPPSRTYVFSRFVRRHRTTVAAASVILLALIAGITMATVGLVRATHAERVASREKEAAEQVAEFMVEMYAMPDPSEALGRTITVEQVLRGGAERIEMELASQPEVQATLMHTMARTYRNLSLPNEARPLFEHALSRRRATLGNDSVAVAETLEELGVLLRESGELDAALAAHSEALAIRRNARGNLDPDVAESINSLGEVYYDKGDYEQAEALYREGLEIYRQVIPGDDAGLSISLNNLAGLLAKNGDFGAAEGLYRESLAMRRRLFGELHPKVATVMNNLGTVLSQKGDYEAAEPFYRDALAMRRKLLGGEHAQVAAALNNLALLLRRKGDYDAAEPLYRESLQVRRKVWGDEHASVATGLNNLAGLLRAKGDLSGAEEVYRQSLALRRKIQGNDHPNAAITQTNLAAVLADLGRHQDGYNEAQQALQVLQTKLSPGHWRAAVASGVAADCLSGLGNYEQAETRLLASLPVIRAARGDDAIYAREAVERLVRLYQRWQKPGPTAEYQDLLARMTANMTNE